MKNAATHRRTLHTNLREKLAAFDKQDPNYAFKCYKCKLHYTLAPRRAKGAQQKNSQGVKKNHENRVRQALIHAVKIGVIPACTREGRMQSHRPFAADEK